MAKNSAGSAIVTGAGLLGLGVLALKYGPALYAKATAAAKGATQQTQPKSSGGASGGSSGGGGGTIGSGGTGPKSAGITPEWIQKVFGLAPDPKNVDYSGDSIPYSLEKLLASLGPAPDPVDVDFSDDSIPNSLERLLESLGPADTIDFNFGDNFIPFIDGFGSSDIGGGGSTYGGGDDGATVFAGDTYYDEFV